MLILMLALMLILMLILMLNDDADADHLDGVELLDLNLDPGDVVVVKVLHLLQLVFKPENFKCGI